MTTESTPGRGHSKAKDQWWERAQVHTGAHALTVVCLSQVLCALMLGRLFSYISWVEREELQSPATIWPGTSRVLILKMGTILSSSHGWHCGLNKTNYAKFSTWPIAGT